MSPKIRAVVFKVLCFLTLAFLGVIVFSIGQNQGEQNTKYLEIKDNVPQNTPGRVMIIYPWEPTSAEKVLPFDYTVPSNPGNNLSIWACPGEFEPASFIISAQKDISGIQISVPDLYSAQGNNIPADTIDVRLVKVWYQANDKDISGYTEPGHFLTPELLLKDDALVQVDYINKINYLRVTTDSNEHYIDISTPTAIFPANAEIYDASSLQPFSLKTNENKQVWLTVHVPDNTPAGDYYGNIAITTSSASPVYMNFSVTVLPFDLEPTPLRYILYYGGRVADTSWRETPIGQDWKTPEQYAIDLQDMKDHGVMYPTFSQDDLEPSPLNTALTLRSQSGMPKDRIYLEEWNAPVGNATDAAGLAKVANLVKKWRNYTETHGFGATYFHGMDEVTGKLVVSQRDAWKTVRSNGGRMVTTSFDTTDPIDLTGDILDAANIGTKTNTTAASVMHSYGHEIYLYNQPQGGVENPAIYRKNYGFALWNSGYDGEMVFGYQWGYGNSIWNDYDFDGARDHVFAYPTSDGVIDTIQWEGFREGVDDTRYVAALIKTEGNTTSARIIVSSALLEGNDTATIREKVIARILILQT